MAKCYTEKEALSLFEELERVRRRICLSLSLLRTPVWSYLQEYGSQAYYSKKIDEGDDDKKPKGRLAAFPLSLKDSLDSSLALSVPDSERCQIVKNLSDILDEVDLSVIFDILDKPSGFMNSAGPSPLTRHFKLHLRSLVKWNKKLCRVRDRVIEINLGLAYDAPSRFGYRHQNLSLNDLQQEATRGLMKAVDKFKPSFSNKFSTYATLWIKQEIRRSIHNKGDTIRRPVHQHELSIKIMAIEDEAEGEAVSHHEVATRLLEDEYEAKGRPLTLAELKQKLPAKIQQVKAIRESATSVISMDRPISESSEGEETLGDFIASDSNPVDFASSIDRDVNMARVLKALDSFPIKERIAIMAKFKIKNYQAETETLIEEVLRWSRERMRRHLVAGLRKMSTPGFISQTTDPPL